MDTPVIQRPKRIQWLNVLTVVSAAILISAEVFGAAFAGSWAIASLLSVGAFGARILDGVFVLCGIFVMVQFVRAAIYLPLKQKRLRDCANWIISTLAQFRTCLWPCVGRWASGQEAGQPPKEETLLPCSRDRQPEANRRCQLSTGDAA